MRAFAGQKLKQSPLASASVQNDMLGAAADWKRRQLGGGDDIIRSKKLTDIVGIRNLTGSDAGRGSVLQLGDALLSAPDNDQLWFGADTPEDPAELRFCILREPIVDGDIGDAQVSGVCLAWVDVSDEEHAFARPQSGQTHAASAESGPLEILSPVGETGLQELVVRFVGFTPAMPDEIEGTLDDDVDETSDGSFDVTITFASNGDLDLIDETVEVINPPSGLREGEFVFSGTAGATVRATRFGDTLRCTWIECDEEE